MCFYVLPTLFKVRFNLRPWTSLTVNSSFFRNLEYDYLVLLLNRKVSSKMGSVYLIGSKLAFGSRGPQFKSRWERKFFLFCFWVVISWFPLIQSDRYKVGCRGVAQSSSGLSMEGPTKVKARKSYLFTERSLKVENKEHLIDFIVTLYFISLCSNALHSSKVKLFDN